MKVNDQVQEECSAQDSTVEALLGESGRRSASVPISRSFVQQGEQRSPAPGPLRDLVRRHDETALDMFMLHRALASSAPWDVARDARVWARALGLDSGSRGGAANVSRGWRRLDQTYALVSRHRRGRLASVMALSDDGSGQPYAIGDDPYFRVPFAYWTAPARYYRSLTLPAKAALLVAFSLRQPFKLAAERAPAWYGISADTMDRGLRELRLEHGVLDRSHTRVSDWLSPTGFRDDYTFELIGPLAANARVAR